MLTSHNHSQNVKKNGLFADRVISRGSGHFSRAGSFLASRVISRGSDRVRMIREI